MKNKYFMRVVRKNKYDLHLDSSYLKSFRELAKMIYGDENVRICFAYGQYGGEFFSEDLSYFEATNSYTNYTQFGIEAIEVFEIIDESKVSIHPAYFWSDALYELLGNPCSEEFVENFRTIIKEKITAKTSNSLNSLLDQVVFREDLDGVRLIERRNASNLSPIEIEMTVNFIADKYKLTY